MKKIALLAIVACFFLSTGAFAQTGNGMAMLENPASDSYQSGIAVISGWACDAQEIVIEIDEMSFTAAYGTMRGDTQERCGDTDNGFSFLWNWNNSGDGEHTVRALADGTPFGEATVTVTTFGTEFLRDAHGVYSLTNFPTSDEETRVQWEESLQNFVIRDNPTTFTRDFVQAALDRYDRDGREATAAHYNSQASAEGQWYVFIIDENDLFIAHPIMPELIGQDIKTIVGSDGYELGREIARATEAGHWIHYPWPNPVTGEEEPKHTWAIRHDGLIFGSGYYESLTDDATPLPVGNSQVAGVAAVLENPAPGSFHSGMAVLSGWACEAEEILIQINDMSLTAAYGTVRGDTQAVCGDIDNGFSLLLNWNILGDGVHTVRAFLDGTLFAQVPVTVTTFGVEMLGDEEKAAFTQNLVQAALDRYDRDGREATVAYHNSPASVDGEWYVFIIDENDLIISQPVLPNLIGQDNKTIVASDGYEVGREMTRTTEAGHWIHYLWPNPAAGGAEEPKHSWVIRHDGLIFGSGYYGPPNLQEYALADFPTTGSDLTLQWSQPLQNFVITSVLPSE